MNSTSQQQSGWSQQPPSVLRWRVWPVLDRWYVGLVAILLLLALIWQVYIATGKPHLVFLVGGLLFLAMCKLLLPISYELNSEGIHYWFLGLHRTVAWTKVRRFEQDRKGVLLLASPNPYPLEAAGGLYLPWGESTEEEVMARVRYYVEPTPESDEALENDDTVIQGK